MHDSLASFFSAQQNFKFYKLVRLIKPIVGGQQSPIVKTKTPTTNRLPQSLDPLDFWTKKIKTNLEA